jgi:hypothetical protein
MKIKFNVDVEDMVAYLQFPKRITPSMRKVNTKYKILGLVGYICMNTTVLLVMGQHYSDIILTCTIGCAVWLLCYRFLTRIIHQALLLTGSRGKS